jgi:hypothetical protein
MNLKIEKVLKFGKVTRSIVEIHFDGWKVRNIDGPYLFSVI